MENLPSLSEKKKIKYCYIPKRTIKTSEIKKRYHEIIPMLNPSKANNCFINSIIQILYHTPNFKEKFFKIPFDKNDKNILNNPLYQLKILLLNYKKYLYTEELNTLDIKNFRIKLSHYYKDMSIGINGDPVEALNNILNAIHLYSTKQKLNEKNPSSYECNNCISHEFFSLSVQDKIFCSECKIERTNEYDKNYFIYEIFIFEILERIQNLDNESYKNKLFSLAKEVNNFAEQKIKLDGCNCTNRTIIRNVCQCYYYNPIFIINLTWERQFPRKTDICKIYYLIPLFDKNGTIFTLEEGTLNVNYYLYGIVLYYNGHYICAIYKDNFWFIIDDTKYNKYDSYLKMVSSLISSTYYPVMLFYSYTDINIENVKGEFMTKDFNNLYHKCYRIDIKNGENVSSQNLLLDSWEKEVTWICAYCKKRNNKSSLICWCCKNKKCEFKKNSFSLFNEEVNINETTINEKNIGNNYVEANKKEINQNQFTYDINQKKKIQVQQINETNNNKKNINNINNINNQNHFNNNGNIKDFNNNENKNLFNANKYYNYNNINNKINTNINQNINNQNQLNNNVNIKDFNNNDNKNLVNTNTNNNINNINNNINTNSNNNINNQNHLNNNGNIKDSNNINNKNLVYSNKYYNSNNINNKINTKINHNINYINNKINTNTNNNIKITNSSNAYIIRKK